MTSNKNGLQTFFPIGTTLIDDFGGIVLSYCLAAMIRRGSQAGCASERTKRDELCMRATCFENS